MIRRQNKMYGTINCFRKSLLLVVSFFFFSGLLAQNETQNTIKTIGSLFSKKKKDADSSAFINNPEFADLSGTWEGKYILQATPQLKYDYKIVLKRKGANLYEGVSESTGMPIMLESRDHPLYKKMQAYVSVSVLDSPIYSKVIITENNYMRSGYTNSYLFWPLKKFDVKLIPSNKIVKIEGRSIELMNISYELKLKKVSNVYDTSAFVMMNDLKDSKLKYTLLKFESSRKDSLLYYMGNGKISFNIYNAGTAVTPDNISMLFAATDEKGGIISQDVLEFSNPKGRITNLNSGNLAFCEVSVLAKDRILSDYITVKVAVIQDENNTIKELLSSEIKIKIKNN
jgi:hypothetical protein